MYTREVLKTDNAYNSADLRAIVKTDCQGYRPCTSNSYIT